MKKIKINNNSLLWITNYNIWVKFKQFCSCFRCNEWNAKSLTSFLYLLFSVRKKCPPLDFPCFKQRTLIVLCLVCDWREGCVCGDKVCRGVRSIHVSVAFCAHLGTGPRGRGEGSTTHKNSFSTLKQKYTCHFFSLLQRWCQSYKINLVFKKTQ